MFWKQEDLTKWVEHINNIVGEDSLEGAYIAGEKAKELEVIMAGEKEEVLELLASAVYSFSRQFEMAFEDAMEEIKKSWEKLGEKKCYGKIGDEVIDVKTGIGIDETKGVVTFPIPPKSVEEEIIAFFNQTNGKIENVTKRLHTREEIYEFFSECTEIGSFDVNEDNNGEKGLGFEWNGDKYLYYPNDPGRLCLITEVGLSDEFFENDEVFREIALKLLESQE